MKNAKNAKESWKGIKSIIGIKDSKKSIINSLSLNENMISDPKEIADNFNDYFSSIACKLQEKIYNGHDFKNYLHDRLANNFFITPTDKFEVSDIIRNLNPNKSSGPHSIPTKILKEIVEIIAEPLAEIINLPFCKGIFINNLKISKVIPIFKEKGCASECSNYRPISLLSNINKIFEKLMHQRLYSFLSVNKCIYDLQFGFRNQHSTNHALIDLTEDIRETLDNSLFAVGIFIDLQKAFDTVDHKILLSKLDHYGIRGIANDWFRSYLTNRQQYVFVNDTNSDLKYMLYGVPQGSVLGPLLFLIYINDLNKAIKFATVRHFADDTCLLIKNKDLKKLQKQLNLDLKFLCKWLRANKISLNSSKTEMIIFRHSKKKTDYNLNVKINGKKLFPSSHVKYLGIYLDSHLNWSYQCDILAAKLSRINGILSKVRHLVPQKTLKEIYHAIFSSVLSYGIQIWGQFESKYIKRVTRLQNIAIKIIDFAKFDASKNILYKESKILKLVDYVQLLNFLYVYDCLKGIVPDSLQNDFSLRKNRHTYSTKASTENQVSLPKSHTEMYGIRSIKYSSAQVWNNFMTNLSHLDLINKSKAFCKIHIKISLFDNY